MRYLPFILGAALMIYALIDCARHEDDEMPGRLPKPLWIVIVVIFPLAGAVAWLVVSRVELAKKQRRRPSGSGYSAPGQPTRYTPPRRTRQLAPDDDPDFLAELELERRRAQRRAEDSSTTGAGGSRKGAEPSSPRPVDGDDARAPGSGGSPVAPASESTAESPEDPDDEPGDGEAPVRRT